MGIQLRILKSRSSEDVGESTRLDVQMDFSEIHVWISIFFKLFWYCNFYNHVTASLVDDVFPLYFSFLEKLALQFWRYWKLMLSLFYTYRYRSVLAVKLWQPSISVKLIPLLCVCFIVGKYGTIMYELYSIVLCLCLDNCSLYVISLLHLSWSMRFLWIEKV